MFFSFRIAVVKFQPHQCVKGAAEAKNGSLVNREVLNINTASVNSFAKKT